MNKVEKDQVKKSKWLSKVLRHDPKMIDLTLDDQGWGEVDHILKHINFSLDELKVLVAENNKKRFELSSDCKLIRAVQGHSVDVDLGYTPAADVPNPLFHGTAEAFMEPILVMGLKKMGRNHVHLSADISVARQVGSRHGKPVVLEVDTARMITEGHLFYIARNGVWLTESVPAAFLKVH